jgi:hypothetical protein
VRILTIKQKLLTGLSTLLLSYTGQILAVPLGLPESTAKIGIAGGAALVSVDDPDGDTETTTGVQPFGLVYTDWFVGDIRYWTEAFYYAAELDASSDKIGQDVERYGVRFSLQKSFRIIQAWAPWFGLGLDVSKIDYTLRHTKDNEGFLLQRFDDRSETGVSLLVNVVSEWPVGQAWSVGLKLEQSVPLSGDTTDFLASGILLYRF